MRAADMPMTEQFWRSLLGDGAARVVRATAPYDSRSTVMSTRVSKVANIIIPVANQDRALQFYTDVLGLEKRTEAPFGDGARWIEVAPSGAETVIAICPPGPNVTPGNKETGITLQ